MKRSNTQDIADEAKKLAIASATAQYTQIFLRQMRTTAAPAPTNCKLCNNKDHTLETCPIENKFRFAQDNTKCLICLKTKSHCHRSCRSIKFVENLCEKDECDTNGLIHNKFICPQNCPPIATPTKKAAKN
ncbi:hypothetical protein CAEBREN_21542 [Caenorhabditis brenneri]|uniref:Uncharacterized protein n=1 Tax=Caenorhabditis brenneri TaxID=135651 RepID=G0NIR4_CAEBE|nr:hypothetical protein CAEBREN_03043 [Caenorhabditis brenneri]EGT60097.1 hypothetical protein CAEBREN_21542 [Caenorhabditis brenneri]